MCGLYGLASCHLNGLARFSAIAVWLSQGLYKLLSPQRGNENGKKITGLKSFDIYKDKKQFLAYKKN